MTKAEEVLGALQDFVVGEHVLVTEHWNDSSRVLVPATISHVWDNDTIDVFIAETHGYWSRRRDQVKKDWTRWPPKPKK